MAPKYDGELLNGLLREAPPFPPRGMRQRPRGPIAGTSIDTAFTWLLYTVLILLITASWLGTFYGILGARAPLYSAWAMALDVVARPALAFQAFGVQAFLTIVQWGARRRARTHSPIYWLLWLAGLAPSVYYNLGSYYEPMVALGVPYVLAALMIIGGDVIPEVFGQRD